MPTAIPWTDRGLVRLALCFLLLVYATSARSAAQFDYLLHCAGCHLEDGGGMTDVVPDLKEDLGWFASREEGRSYLIRVPGSSQSPLDDAELAALLNWMVARFAPDSSSAPFTQQEVGKHRGEVLHDAVSERVRLLEQKQSARVGSPGKPLSLEQRRAFGRLLFHDQTLSRNSNLACASCHDPGRAFSDARPASIVAGASLGSDGSSFGTRNAPALTYIGMTPGFDTDVPAAHDPAATRADAIRGGFFWDGRMATLEDQVLRPFVNEREMGLRDRQELAARVRDDPRYQQYLGDTHSDAVLDRVAASLAAYLRSDELNRFDSRYDRYLRGEIAATREEIVGMGLFFSPAFTGCAECHQSQDAPYARGELFTNHRYANIGTPISESLLQRSAMGPAYRDPGLGANPAAREAFDQAGLDRRELDGRFKVSSLRNVAVTAPYMHNGVFDELSTVLSFYNHFNESGASGQTNPETSQPWGETSNPDGVQRERLRSGFPLSPRQLSALTAFLRMLTDQSYEHLMN